MRAVLVFGLVLSLAAASLAAGPAGAVTANPGADPLEGFNRSMFSFNNEVVDHVIEPLSGALQAWVPPPVREAGARFYDNLTEPEFIVTNLFSGNNADAGVSASRFAINSTLGIAGLFDPATGMGFIRRETEFGESLCHLGVSTHPFVVLPLIGPTNVWSAGLLTGFFAVEWYALSLISSLLATADLVVDISASAASLRHAADQPDMAAHDPYTLQRAEYLQYIEKGCGAINSKGNQPVASIH